MAQESNSRRDFLKLGAAGLAAGVAAACAAPARPGPAAAPLDTPAPASLATETPAAAIVSAPTTQPTQAAAPKPAWPSPEQRTLVVLQLSGGHDGLNAVVPYGDGLYYQLRPQIAVPADQVIALDQRVGFHPNLKSLKQLYDHGQLAILQGVGYPNPNRSHFRSMEIWQTARPDGAPPDHGWLGAFMAEVYRAGDSPFQCVNFGTSIPAALVTAYAPVAAMQDTANFQFLAPARMPYVKDPLLKTFGQLYTQPARKTPALELVANNWSTVDQGVHVLGGLGQKYQAQAQYPGNPFAKTVQQVAQMIVSDVGTRVFYVQLGGFDTHSNERPVHGNLMTQLADTLAAFQADLEHHGRAQQVLLMAFSEFGRRVAENGSQGTDHGAAGPMFVLGAGVKGGLYGEYPDLGKLDQGDLRFATDFRSVYATVIEDWLGAPSQDVLGGTFERLPFVALT
jgi:uncharacterized protein (DUF1501 family)